MSTSPRSRRLQILSEPSSSTEEVDDEIYVILHNRQANASSQHTSAEKSYGKKC